MHSSSSIAWQSVEKSPWGSSSCKCKPWLPRRWDLTNEEIYSHEVLAARSWKSPQLMQKGSFFHHKKLLQNLKVQNLQFKPLLILQPWDPPKKGHCKLCRSTTNWLQRYKFMGGPLIAVSRWYKTVALSSCEAEYCTFVDCVNDILWVRAIVEFFKCPFPTLAVLWCGNLTAKHMAVWIQR